MTVILAQNNELVELRLEGELTESGTTRSTWYAGVISVKGSRLVLQLAGATFADRAGVRLLRDLEVEGWPGCETVGDYTLVRVMNKSVTAIAIERDLALICLTCLLKRLCHSDAGR
jgi:hypothetical protein